MVLGQIGGGGGFNIGSIIQNVVGQLMPGQGGQMLGGMLGGLGSLMGGDMFGGINQLMQMFQQIAGGMNQQSLPGALPGNVGGRMPMPQMPGMQQFGGMPQFGGFPGMMGGVPNPMGASAISPNGQMGALGSAFNDLKGLRGQMQGLMNDKNMSPEDKQMMMMQLQQQMEAIQQMIQMLSNISKSQHQTAMAIVGNLR